MRKLIFSMMFVAVAGGLCPAQETKSAAELTDPTEILKKADDASKAINSVKYTATAKGTGAEEKRTPKVEGTVWLNGYKNGRPEKVRFEAKVTPPDGSATREIVMGNDGNEYFVIDAAKKIAYVDIDPAVTGSAGRMVGLLTMLEYVHETPFSDEINGEEKTLKGTEKVGGEDCYHIYVKYSQQGQEADWYFSKKDFLPRKVNRKFTSRDGGEPGGRELIVTALTVDPKSDKDPFKFELPEGFEKSDDFAP